MSDELDLQESMLKNLELANLELADLQSTHIRLIMKPRERQSRLIELPEEIKLSSDEILNIYGRPDDVAIGCAGDNKYEIKLVETTDTIMPINSDLLAEIKQQSNGEHTFATKEIIGVFNSYYDLRFHPTNYQKLYGLICHNQSLIKSIDDVKKVINGELHGFTIPAMYNDGDGTFSKASCYLVKCLTCMNFRNQWFLLTPEFVSWIIELVGYYNEPRMFVDRLSLTPEFITLTEEMPEIEDFIQSMVSTLFVDFEKTIKRSFAISVLRHVKSMLIKEFLQVWESILPQGLVPELSILNGFALLSEDKRSIYYMDKFDLPHNVQERIDILFEVKRALSYDELSPYVEDFEGTEEALKKTLMKYTHVYTVNDKVFYRKRKT